MGYKLAGCQMIGCLELDPRMMELYRKNHHPSYSFTMDIRDFVDFKPLPEELFALDILDGSPPCSVFSMAGQRDDAWGKEKKFREGQKAQRLDDLFLHFISLAQRLRPKVIIAENVSGLMKGAAKGYVNEILKAYANAGYDTQIFRLNAKAMGVPQARERLFFISRRRDLGWPKLRLHFQEPPITFGEIRTEKGRPSMDEKGVYASLLRHRLPTDKTIKDISLRLRGRYTGFNNAIISDGDVCPTITASGSFYRMCDGMRLSEEDFVAAQTFPQDYQFLGQSPQYVCGMSVPPVMMAQIAQTVIQMWFSKKNENKKKYANIRKEATPWREN